MEINKKENLIIFSDLDGTALASNHSFTNETIEMVQNVYKEGYYFCPVTARSTADAIRQAKILGLDKLGGIVAGNNGSQIFDFKTNEWIYNKHIDREIVEEVFAKTFGEIGKYKVHYFGDDITYVYGSGENSRYWSDVMQVEYKVIDSVEQIDKPITHMTVILAKDVTDADEAEFFNEFSHLSPEIDILKYTKRVYEVCSKGINKGFAVKKICEYLGYKRSNTTSFAFGDSHNDFDLFAQVDYAVAMGNALSELLDSAEAVTKTNDEHGVAHFVNSNILNKGEK